ncbi:MAG: PRC-barrel domain-containing protein [Actinomycetota bacterium]|nr:PRC-barrel domain-containing protein [Actinomycetota bacterium]
MGAQQGARELRKMEDLYSRYDVVDQNGDKVGTVDAAYIDERDQHEYVAVSRGVIGLIPGTGSSLIPLDICRVDNNRRTIELSVDKDMVKDSPSVDTGKPLSSEQASQVRGYYRL